MKRRSSTPAKSHHSKTTCSNRLSILTHLWHSARAQCGSVPQRVRLRVARREVCVQALVAKPRGLVGQHAHAMQRFQPPLKP